MKSIIKKMIVFVLAFAMILPAFIVNEQEKVWAADTISFTESAGWFESAYAKWTPVTGASGYKAYVKAASEEDSAYMQLDNELIRQYKDYWRADQVGLKAGTYVMKVQAVDDAGKVIAEGVTESLTVAPYDRSGFAWVNGTSSGAYNEDGTLKDDAVVIYVTDKNKDDLNAQIITAADGSKTTCNTIIEVMAAIKRAQETRPVAIRIIGNVTDAEGIDTNKDCKGDWAFETNNRKYGLTIEGIGDDATANGWGIRLQKASNVEIRNIGFMNCDSVELDDVGLTQDNDHIWVHNCDFFYGKQGSASDQMKGDGALDSKKSTYVTFSYNHFVDNGKCNLLGNNAETTDGYYITYHHNWYDHSDSRHPRARFYSAHIYNNYYDGNSKYGVGACVGASLFVENNYFRNCPRPIMISMQGTDVYSTGTKYSASNATFSKEAGGMIKAYNNVMTGNYTFIPYGCEKYMLKGTETAFALEGTTSVLDFDAYVVDAAADRIPETVKANMGASSANNASYKNSSLGEAYQAGNTYNNFDTNSELMYSYTPDAPQAVPEIVKKSAGRMNGGDFKWTFIDSDDSSHDVNAGLRAAVDNYKTNVMGIGGINTVATGSTGDTVNGGTSTEDSGSGSETQDETKTYVLNAGDVETGTYSESFKTGTDNYFTVSATAGETVVVDANSKTCGIVTVDQRIKLSGTGKEDGTSRTINFTTTGKGVFTVYMCASSASASREVLLYRDGTQVNTVTVPGSIGEFKFTLDGAGTYVLASKSGGLNVYYGTVVEEKASSESGNGSGNGSDTESGSLNGWVVENGVKYWYEDGVKQGLEGRGKEIYDEGSDAWYWLDAADGGMMAVSKDVYQESDAGIFADDAKTGKGKWVRYDAEGHMVKGWCVGKDADAKVISSPSEANGADVYYFDPIFGTMVKGYYTIDGTEYYFNTDTGVLEREIIKGLGVYTGWKTIDGADYWYEDGQRQGVRKDASYRGKEIYDPASDAWYWLDNAFGGKKAVSKDVYQESEAGEWGDIDNGDGTKNGKWVRYDANGHMIKGWCAGKDADAKAVSGPADAVGGLVYYFDITYGTMAKGSAMIDGKIYTFDSVTGELKK